MKFKHFKERKIVVEHIDYESGEAFERTVSISLDSLGKLDLVLNSQMKIKSWGCGWGTSFTPKEFIALKEIIKDIEVIE